MSIRFGHESIFSRLKENLAYSDKCFCFGTIPGDQLRAYVEGRIDMKGNFWLCPDFVDSVANVLDDLSFEIR